MNAFWTYVLGFWYLTALFLVGFAPLFVVVFVAALIADWLDDRNRKGGP